MRDSLRPSFLGTMLRAGLPFGVLMGLWLTLRHGLPGGPEGGLACGLAFGALLWIFLLVQQRGAHTELILEGGETLLRRGLANHFRGVEAAGGVLFLTSRRLVFKPHKANVQTEPWALPLAEVAGVAPKNILAFVPNGLLVERKDGGSERFVIGDRGAWIRDIGGAIGRSGGTGR